jgi:signal transduction histidine kinase/ActR/RegA family two-component response regulator
MMRTNKPSPPWTSTLVIVLLSAVWGYIRLFVFRESIFPLTFVLPLLVCVWSRRSWHLVAMAGAFMAMASWKLRVALASGDVPRADAWAVFIATLLNVSIGAFVVQVIMSWRQRLAEHTDKITQQNAELEHQAEELSQQNEEIRAQTEELAQQNEEIETQAEELSGQNADLHELVDRLANREEMLQMIVRAAGTTLQRSEVLQDVCRKSVKIIGAPAESVVVLELKEFSLHRRASAGATESLPQKWPLHGSLAQLVLNENRTACVDDLRERPDLAAPFPTDSPVRSILAAPIEGKPGGVLMILSGQVVHWSQEQFHVAEWLAAQCGLILESLAYQESISERSRQLESANRTKDQFLAMLSHELRTPLTPVLAASGALVGDPRIPEDVREDLQMIRRNVTVQSRLIDDLLDLTRLERGKLELHKQVLSIHTVLKESATIVAADIDARDQRLQMHFDLPDSTAVLGDSARLQQVFWNLLRNASKFSPPESTIVMRASLHASDRPCVHVEVADTGVGIAAEDLERIFLPFEQAVSRGPRESQSGLGLGLAIAKAVVERHDGTIHASSPGIEQGAVFTVELPITLAPATAGSPVAGFDVSVKSVHARILLVEDHCDTGRLLARLLKGSGFDVEHAETLHSATDLLSRGTYELVISDLGLPDGSGLDLMRNIRQKYPSLPGICLSGYGMETDIQTSHEAGFAEHLTKPVDLQQLHAAVSRVLGRADSVAF